MARRWTRLGTGALGTVLLLSTVACTSTSSSTSTSTLPSSTLPGSTLPGSTLPGPVGTIRAGGCHTRGVLPDPLCTPGAINPAVTQANIHSTICVAGFSTSIRPPSSYTDALKRTQMKEYGFTDRPSAHEEDHLISLELGGNPTDPRNLWPEPGASPNPKDRVEDAAHRAVCAGALSLTAAQQGIASDWVALGKQLGITG